jgi:hypothetical protein
VIQDSEMVLDGDLFLDFIEAIQVRVNDFFALYADEVRMRVRPVAVIPVAAIGKPQLEHLAKRFDQHDISVYRGKAQGGKDFNDVRSTTRRFDGAVQRTLLIVFAAICP